MLFLKKRLEEETPKEPWPSLLNPCRGERHSNALCFDVRGKTTLICAECLAIFEKKLRERNVSSPRLAALSWFFTPDPNGRDCIYSPSSPRPKVPKKPTWMNEVVL
jgi:hypothetical protein